MSFESRQRPLAIFIQIARGLSRSRSRVARGLWRPAFMSPEASGDSFESRERLWRSSFRSPEASRDVVCESREALTQLYCIRASRDSQTTSREASGDLNDDRQSLSRLSNESPEASRDSRTTSREASGDLNDNRERPLATLK